MRGTLGGVVWMDGGQVGGPTAGKGGVRIEGPSITGKAQRAPPGARVIDASGLFLVPAFIDAHVHLSVAGEPELVAREELRKGVAAGLAPAAPPEPLPPHRPPPHPAVSRPP